MTAPDLLELAENSVILTPNERLSRRLHTLYGGQQLTKNNTVWPAPPILSLKHWLLELYQEALEVGLMSDILLSDAQYQALWQGVAKDNFTDYNFIHAQQTAIDMRAARQLLTQWQVHIRQDLFNASEEAKLFQLCSQQIDQLLKEKSFFTEDELPDKLNDEILASLLTIRRVVLFAFDEITPQYVAFFERLKKQGILIETIDHRDKVSTCTQYALPSRDKEYYAMAQWAKKQLCENNSEKLPPLNSLRTSQHRKIICIVPDLNKTRTSLARIFYEVFHPESLFSPYSTSPWFNISGGVALSTLPMFQTVFTLLSLFNEKTNYSVISNFILSPFINMAETEKFQRIALDMKLRDTVLETLHYRDISPYRLNEYCPYLSQIWDVLKNADPSKKYCRPSEWVIWLSQLLMDCVWPGERTLNSEEYQQLQHWESVLTELSTLDDFCKPLNYSAFIALLKQRIDAIAFQIKTHDAPVQILGVLEAAGSLADAIWIAELTDKTWPPAVKPNPYIPLDLQHRLNMPHASSQRQYEYSLQMMQGWARSTEALYVSYAEREGDEVLAPSPLLKLFSPKIDNLSPSNPFLLYELIKEIPLETWIEPSHLPFSITTDRHFSASLFEQQITCPFKAFAVQRLKSIEFKTPQTSWDARRRGTNLHDTMEVLWKKWRHSNHLHALSEEALNQDIEQAVTQILKKNLAVFARTHTFFELEKARLTMIIRNWIPFEKSRPPFKVAAVEYKQYILFPLDKTSLSLSLRIDRIDHTDAGEWILIDYKTNAQSLQAWFENPPTQSQLPLYASLFKESLSGISYASLHPSSKKMKFTGIARHSELIPDVRALEQLPKTPTTSWDELIQHWKLQLQGVAQDFIDGNVAVKPNSPIACHQCHLAAVCRINDR
ncbi:MAG: PD-(D/E)XK nuclease family protein [Gammaproteobacteria bacterium]|nr:PD-(D/E)XK nuclease family protein [Gammaproteobacteria bacterium]